MNERAASIRLVEIVDDATQMFRPLDACVPHREMQVVIDGVLYRTDRSEPITLKLNAEGRISTVTVPFIVREFETRRIYR